LIRGELRGDVEEAVRNFSTSEIELGGEMDDYTSTNLSYKKGCCRDSLLSNAM
jgi:hypothetical protein